jgi:hypothetical protein
MMRRLDFIVVGAQKAGTTSLWQYLRGHPRLFLPRGKEAPFFIFRSSARPGEFDAFMHRNFAGAPVAALLGKVTPDYMLGRGELDVEMVVERIAQALPEVKIVVLLRDPIERAISNYTMEARRRQESRSVDDALEESLDEKALATARARPTFTNSYVVQGEYGRILEVFRTRFKADQILVEQSRDLAADPGAVIDRTLSFLGQPTGYRPPDLGARHFRGGIRKRIDAPAEAELFDYLRREVLPHMNGDSALHANAFGFFFETWNVVPDKEQPQPSPEVRARLEDHYLEDAGHLADLGVEAPWIAAWSAPRPS